MTSETLDQSITGSVESEQKRTVTVNGVRLFCALTGEAGPPLVLVHGNWSDHHSWDRVAPTLSERCRVLAYDRRGHSRSERPPDQRGADQHGDDLAALLEHFRLAPAHMAGSSFGGCVLLRLAARRPDLFRSLAVHEPPLFDLLAGEPALASLREEARAIDDTTIARLTAGDLEGAACQFVESVFGPGSWEQLPPQTRQTFVGNAPIYITDRGDPNGNTVDLAALASFPRPVLLSRGDQSSPFFPPVLDKLAEALPRAETHVYAGAGHVPHLSHPTEYAATLSAFVEAAEAVGLSR